MNPKENGNGSETSRVTLTEIREYRKLAAGHQNNISAKIITRLLDELQSVRDELVKLRLRCADKYTPYDDNAPCPFGQYKGERLADVPEDYLRWWFNTAGKREMIVLDMDYGPWPKRVAAFKRLKLYDYIKERFNGGPEIH
jgi:hypothetical protein